MPGISLKSNMFKEIRYIATTVTMSSYPCPTGFLCIIIASIRRNYVDSGCGWCASSEGCEIGDRDEIGVLHA